MALLANIPRVMVIDIDLMEPFRTGGAGFMTADALAVTELRQLHFGVLYVSLGRPVAGFAGKPFMLRLCQFLHNFAVASVAGFSSRPVRFSGRDFLQR